MYMVLKLTQETPAEKEVQL